jgi:hypothetical protein
MGVSIDESKTKFSFLDNILANTKARSERSFIQGEEFSDFMAASLLKFILEMCIFLLLSYQYMSYTTFEHYYYTIQISMCVTLSVGNQVGKTRENISTYFSKKVSTNPINTNVEQ